MTTLIGHRCKCCKVRSRVVLIARKACAAPCLVVKSEKVFVPLKQTGFTFFKTPPQYVKILAL